MCLFFNVPGSFLFLYNIQAWNSDQKIVHHWCDGFIHLKLRSFNFFFLAGLEWLPATFFHHALLFLIGLEHWESLGRVPFWKTLFSCQFNFWELHFKFRNHETDIHILTIVWWQCHEWRPRWPRIMKLDSGWICLPSPGREGSCRKDIIFVPSQCPNAP